MGEYSNRTFCHIPGGEDARCPPSRHCRRVRPGLHTRRSRFNSPAAAGRSALPAVPEPCVSARSRRRAKGGPARLGCLRGGQAQRLHGGGPGIHARAADEFHEGRRHRHVGHPDIRRRLDGRVRARDGAEPLRLGGESDGGSQRPRTRDLGGAHGRRPGLAGRRRREPRPGARRQFGPLREGRSDLPREGDARAPDARDGSWGEGVHHRVGRPECAAVVARRPEDRVRDQPHRSQLRRRLRHGGAHREVHVAERGFRREPALVGRRQVHRLRPAPGAALRTAGAAGKSAASGSRADRPSSRRTRRAAAAAARARAAGGANPNIPPAAQQIPGLTRATFKGGYTLSLWKADVATGEAQEVWHNQPNDRMFTLAQQPAARGRLRRVPPGEFGGRGGAAGEATRRRAPSPSRPPDPGRVGPLLLAEYRRRRIRSPFC